MAERTAIGWTDHTFNPWWGCVEVSPGCDHCYARTDATRYGHAVWGAKADRRFFGEKHWAEPLKWNRKAAEAGVRRRVFCASMADVFEEQISSSETGRGIDDARRRLWDTILSTPSLDWLLLTKRPAGMRRLLPPAIAALVNVWPMVTVESQDYTWRIDELLRLDCAGPRGVSYEPALGPVEFRRWLRPGHDYLHGDGDSTVDCARRCGAWAGPSRSGGPTGKEPPEVGGFGPCPKAPRLDWLIVGGESGPGARRCQVRWIRSVRDQCRAAGVPLFIKQMGAAVVDRNDAGFTGWDDGDGWPDGTEIEEHINGYREDYQGAPVRVKLRDRKGADPSEWPADLRVQAFPTHERSVTHG